MAGILASLLGHNVNHEQRSSALQYARYAGHTDIQMLPCPTLPCPVLPYYA